jgi:hypothetical protein
LGVVLRSYAPAPTNIRYLRAISRVKKDEAGANAGWRLNRSSDHQPIPEGMVLEHLDELVQKVADAIGAVVDQATK